MSSKNTVNRYLFKISTYDPDTFEDIPVDDKSVVHVSATNAQEAINMVQATLKEKEYIGDLELVCKIDLPEYRN